MSLLAAIALALIPQGQAQDARLDAKIDYETVAAPIARALQEIGEKAGVTLNTIPILGNPVVVVRVKGVPLRELMAKLASVTGGEWRQEENSYRLVRDAAAQNREANEERLAKLAAAKKAIKQFVDSALKPPAPPGKGANAQSAAEFQGAFPGFGGGGADRVAIAKLLSTIDPALIAGLEDEGRIVFSTSTTRMQRPFNGNVEPVFAQLVAEHNKRTANRVEAGRPKTAEEEELEKWAQSIFGDRYSDKPVEERPAKALFIVGGGGFMGFGGGTNLELRLYGASGKVLLSGQSLGWDEGIMQMDQTFSQGQNTNKPAPAANDKEIEFSAQTKELTSIFAGVMQGNTAGLSKELEEKLSRPDLYDPLSFVTSESLLFAGKHKNLNVVANLPDGMVSFFGMVMDGQAKTVESFLKQLDSSDETKVVSAEGWLTVRPEKPHDARKHRTDRAALAALIAAAREKGNPSLDDLATYAQKADQPMRSTVAMPYLTLFAPNAMGQGMGGLTDWNMVRLYGSLSMSQRDTLAGGGSIPFGNLLPNQQGLVNRMAFGTSARLRVVDPAQQAEEPGGFFSMISRFMPGGSKDWREEPTEAMPNGLPMNGSLTMKGTEHTVGLPAGPNAITRMMGVVGVEELAMLRYFTEDPKMSQLAGEAMPRIDGLRLGRRRSMQYTFNVAAQTVFEHTLNDDHVEKNAPVTPMDKLPEDFKALIEKRLAQYKKNPLPLPFGTTSPPPR